MENPLDFVDIHCHLLPGLDDGASDLAVSLEMAKMALADGTRTIIATPHQLGHYRQNSVPRIAQRLKELKDALRVAGVPLTVEVGADVRVEADLLTRLREHEVYTLADQKRHVLLELPHELYLPLGPVLRKLLDLGITGILSHPERNRGIQASPRLIASLIAQGCLMQVTSGSFLGAFGPTAQRFAEAMLRQGQIHFVASDGHGVDRRRPVLGKAYERVTHLADATVASLLFRELPGRVLQGETIAPHPVGVRKRRSWLPFARTA